MTASATLSRPRHNTFTPLTLDEIRRAAPAAFAAEPYEGMSSRYAYIPTSEVIQGMIGAGFQAFGASQSHSKTQGKQAHTKHMIRFRSNAVDARAVGDVYPEVVLVNSHDGSSTYSLMAGLFRLVCTNGMVVADSMVESIRVRHTGRVIEDVTRGSVQIVERMPEVIDAVARWRQIQLSQPAQHAFAEAAHTVRFADSDGQINTPISPGQLLAPRRYSDNGSDLWSVFNRVQENVLKGGLSALRPGQRRTTTRAIRGIDQDVRLNRALWILGERMAEGLGGAK